MARNKYKYSGQGRLVTGRSSTFQLTRLAAKYNQMMRDGRVLSNRQAIDVVDERIKQLLDRVDVDDAPDRMKRLVELWHEYTENLDAGRAADAALARRKMDSEFDKAYHDYAAWEQIFEALDLRRKQVESEVKVLTQIKAIITAEDAYELTAKLLAAVMRVVNDEPEKLKKVQYEFARITGEISDSTAKRLNQNDVGGGGEDRGSEGLGDMDQEEFLHPGDQE